MKTQTLLAETCRQSLLFENETEMRKWSKAIAFIMTAALAVGSLSVGPAVQKADAADRIGNYMSWDDDQTTKDIKIPVNPQTFRDLSVQRLLKRWELAGS